MGSQCFTKIVIVLNIYNYYSALPIYCTILANMKVRIWMFRKIKMGAEIII